MRTSKVIYTLAAALMVGCGARGAKVEGEFEHLNTVDLSVVNLLEDSYRIYFVPYSGSQVYLGRVTTGSTGKFRIKLTAERYQDTKLLAISTHRTFGVRPIEATLLRELKGGDLIRWELSGNHIQWTGATENYE